MTLECLTFSKRNGDGEKGGKIITPFRRPEVYISPKEDEQICRRYTRKPPHPEKRKKPQ